MLARACSKLAASLKLDGLNPVTGFKKILPSMENTVKLVFAILKISIIGLAIALMVRPEHCYAISTRYHAENDADRLTTYSAFDFSLFGSDLLPHEIGLYPRRATD